MPVELIVDAALNVTVNTARFETWHAALRTVLAPVKTHNAYTRCAGDICVNLVSTSDSRQLNLAYRQQDKATNVLSFPADIDVPEHNLLGDLAICYALVESEAQTQHKTSEDHLAHLFVHGTLHLLGFDHETSDEALVMEGLERDVLAGLGISDPYLIN